MGLLANLKIRTKVLIALLPLAIMVIIAALYSSDRMSTIDARYSALIANDEKALHNLTLAHAYNNRFGLYLYQEIAETDIDAMRVIDGELDRTADSYRSAMEEAKRESPVLAAQVDQAVDFFDRSVSNSRPVRAATQEQNNAKAMTLIRASYDKNWSKAGQAIQDLEQ